MVVRRLLVTLGVVGIACVGFGSSVASAETVAVSLRATVGPDGTTLVVTAPGCQPTPPGEFEIFVRTRNATTGEIGEGAVAVGAFTAPGQGTVTIPGATPVDSFLLTVSCNGGALTASQPFTLAAHVAAPVAASPNFTG